MGDTQAMLNPVTAAAAAEPARNRLPALVPGRLDPASAGWVGGPGKDRPALAAGRLPWHG